MRAALSDKGYAAQRATAASAAPAPGAPSPTPAQPAVPRRSPLSGSERLELFAERVADYRAIVERCAAAGLEEAVRRAVALADSVLVAPGLPLDIPGARVDDGLTASALDIVDAVVTTAAVAIAETGTIVLDHGSGQGRRAITLVPDRHVCIVRADQVVDDVPDALERLDPRRPLTWISGPSATSDIELTRVEGVHGPRHLHVILVG
ncbi:MAG: lactate utilization protein C [Micrococcales bacterium]|nr:lactate utilization protein C [Micrococcales bacterium]